MDRSPHHVFDGDPERFWISAERGTKVKDHAWIGYAFGEPQTIGASASTRPQSRVRRTAWVEKSLDAARAGSLLQADHSG